MKIHFIVIALIVVCMCALSATLYINELSIANHKTVSLSAFNRTNQKLNATLVLTDRMYKDMTNVSLISDPATFLFMMPLSAIRVAWETLKLTGTALDTTDSFIGDITGAPEFLDLPIPRWFFSGLKGIIVITIVFMIVYLIFKWKVED